MEIKDKFNFGRMWMVLKSDILSNKKQIIYNFIMMYGLFMLIELVVLINCNNSPFYFFTNAYAGMIDTLVSIFALYYISTIMRPMMTKEKRISFLMLPATNAEKFVSRVLYTTAGFFILAMVALIAALLSRYIMLPLVSADAEYYTNSAIIPVFKALFIENESPLIFGTKEVISTGVSTSLIWSLIFLTFSIYMLGGSIWYRYAFIKTIATLTVLFIAGTTVLGMLATTSWFLPLLDKYPVEWANGTAIAITIAFVAGTVFNVWMSFRLFRRSQVIITNKLR